MKELKIDPELRDLLPPLTADEYSQLEKNITENGYDKNFPIMEWHGYIVDGHNRYTICKKHNIDFTVGTLAYKTKEEVMGWMLDIQLGRRNLTPIQRIAVAEKYRPIYEKQAKERQSQAGGDKKSDNYEKSLTANLTEAISKRTNNETNTKLAEIAGVKPTTYKMGAKVLNSDNEELKQRVLSGETTISAGYKELVKPKSESIQNKKINNEIGNINIQADNQPKPIIENGVILLPEDSKENKIMNDIARQMKSGEIDTSKITNDREIETIAAITSDALDAIFNYIFRNIDFGVFTKEQYIKIEEILVGASDCVLNNLKKLEDKLYE